MVKKPRVECIMFKYIYSKLIKKESLDDLSIFIKDYETFEEIPLVSRYSHLDFICSFIEKKDTQAFLLSLSYFYLINIKLYAKKNLTPTELSSFFICLTFNDFEDLKDIGYCIPNFFVTRKLNMFDFLNTHDNKTIIKDYLLLESAFSETGLINTFGFIKTVTKQKLGEDIIRIYAIPNI